MEVNVPPRRSSLAELLAGEDGQRRDRRLSDTPTLVDLPQAAHWHGRREGQYDLLHKLLESSFAAPVPQGRPSKELESEAAPEEVEEARVEYPYEGKGTPQSPFVVEFAEHDPENPMNSPLWSRWLILMTVGSATFCVSFGSSVYTGGLEDIRGAFGVSNTVAFLGLTLYVLGFGIGPMVWAPLSELYGRRLVFICTFAPFVAFQVGCALAQNIETLLICRLLAGTIGSSPLNNSAGVISDIFSARERGLAMAVYALMPFLGPVFGPVASGYIAEQGPSSWRWLFGLLGIYGFICFLGGSFIPETHAPVILRRRADKLRKETGLAFQSVQEHAQQLDHSNFVKLRIYMTRPFALLWRELIVFLFALYASTIYGILYLMFGAYPFVFQRDRGWSEGSAGLPFLAIGIGMLLGVAGVVVDSGRYKKKLAAEGVTMLPPEERLPPACLGGILLPISLAWFAASAAPNVHWIVPTLAGVPFGAGMLLVFMGGTAYLVDAYLDIAASSMAANSFLRSIFAGVFPLFTVQLITRVGTSWCLGILAFVLLACVPIPFAFYKYGGAIRSRSRYAASRLRSEPSPPTHATPPLSTPLERAAPPKTIFYRGALYKISTRDESVAGMYAVTTKSTDTLVEDPEVFFDAMGSVTALGALGDDSSSTISRSASRTTLSTLSRTR